MRERALNLSWTDWLRWGSKTSTGINTITCNTALKEVHLSGVDRYGQGQVGGDLSGFLLEIDRKLREIIT